jgi:hypothetical protein
MFAKNVGGVDRIARGILGTVLVVVAIGALLANRRSTAVAATLGSVALLFNFTTGRCGMNKLLGINTGSRE